MVLGMIVYEGVDLMYNVVKLGYNGVTGVYRWYYNSDAKDKEEQKNEIRKEHKENEEMIKQSQKLIFDKFFNFSNKDNFSSDDFKVFEQFT